MSKKAKKSKNSQKRPLIKSKLKDSKQAIKLPTILGWSLLGVLMILFIVMRCNYLDIPLDRDEGTYLYSGWALLNGEIPYQDFYEVKPPGLFISYALFHLIFGYSNVLLHLGLMLVILLIAFLTYKIVLALLQEKVPAVVSGLTVCFLSFNIGLMGFGIMSEYFLLLPIALSTYLILKSINHDRSLRLLLLSGVALGWALTVRQHALFFGLPLGLYVLYTYWKQWKKIGLFILGITIPAIMLLLLMAVYGSLDDMIYWVFQRPTETYTSAIGWDRGQDFMMQYGRQIWNFQKPLVAMIALGAIATWMVKSLTLKHKIFITVFAICSFLSVMPGFRFYGHYWISLIIAGGILSGMVIALVGQFISPKWRTLSGVAIFAMVIGVFIFQKKDYFFKVNGDRIVNSVYGSNAIIAVDKMSDFLKEQKLPQESIFVFGSEPQVYYNTRTLSETEHIFIGFLHKGGERNDLAQVALIDKFRNNPPDYIYHFQNMYSIGMSDAGSQRLYNWIFSFERNNYKAIGVADIKDKNNVVYKFHKEAQNYQPRNTSYITIYKRL